MAGAPVHPSLLATKANFSRSMAAAATTVRGAARATASPRPPSVAQAAAAAAAAAAGAAGGGGGLKRGSKYQAIIFEIVNFLRKCGPEHPQTVEQIEREAKVQMAGNMELQALLGTHKRVRVVDSGSWAYKPAHDFRDKAGLLEYVREQRQPTGLKGVLRKDIERTFTGFDAALKELVAAKEVFILKGRGQDEIIFYNDKDILIPVDDEMKAMWHAATVPDEKSLQRELEAQGHAKRSAPTQLTPQGDGESSGGGQKRRRTGRIGRVMNTHLLSSSTIDLTIPSTTSQKQ